MLTKIKELPPRDRRFIKDTSEWELIYSEAYVEMLHNMNFDLSDDIYKIWKNTKADESWKDIVLPKEYDFLFDYQKDAMKYSIHHNNRMLLSLDMGGGKTATSLALLDYTAKFPALIVCPQIVKSGWEKEYYKFIDKNDRIKIVDSSKGMQFYDGAYDIVIINYELLARNIDKIDQKKGEPIFIPNETLRRFFKNRFRFGIIDEVHKIKNMETKTRNAISYLLKRTRTVIALTGTPILSSSKDLYPILNLLRGDLFDNYWKFINRYCKSFINYKAGGIKSYYGARNSMELNDILTNNVMFRLTKAEMGKVVDKPLTSVIPLKLKDPSGYKVIIEELQASDAKESKGFGLLTKMREEAWEQKKKNFFEKISDMLEESDEKLVIFAHNKKVIEDILTKYKKIAVKIDGTTSTKNGVRQKIVDGFIKSKTKRIFIGSISATATGLDGLQNASSVVIMAQWPWTFGELDQAISRVHRTGQTKVVNVYHFPGEGTIEELFLKIIDNKAKMSKEVIDNEIMMKKELLEMMLKEAKGET